MCRLFVVVLALSCCRQLAAAEERSPGLSATAPDRAAASWRPAQRDDFARPLEPRGDRILHGAGQRGWEFATYWYTVGERKPAISKRYHRIAEDPAGARLAELAQELRSYGPGRVILELSLGMALNDRSQCAEIAAGKFDGHLDQIAVGLAALEGAPVFIRPGYEFNGAWNGYAAKDYVPAWKHVRARLLEKGVRNAAWVWCYIPEGKNLDWEPYYPGDDQVDWWSLDLFKKAQIEHPNAAAFVEEARRRRFPVLISESAPQLVGVADTALAWQGYYGPYWDFIGRHPNIKAFCMINRDWTLWPKYRKEWRDGRLDHNEELFARWRAHLAHPALLHAEELRNLDLLHLPGNDSARPSSAEEVEAGSNLSR